MKINKFLFVLVFFISCASNKNNTSPASDTNVKTETTTNTQEVNAAPDASCLVNVDWCYPNCSDPNSAWKFSNDGTFNYSTTAFGGMSAWGNWTSLENGEFKISYTKTTEGSIPNDQTITLTDCHSLKIGSTTYSN